MKRCFFVFAFLFFVSNVFAGNFYIKANIETDFYKENKQLKKSWKAAFQNIQAYGKEMGIQVFDYDELPIDKTKGWLISEKDSLKNSIKSLKSQRASFEKEIKEMEKYSFVITSYDGKTPEEQLQEYDERIAKLQKDLDDYDSTHIDPDTLAPLLTFKFHHNQGWDSNTYDITTTFRDKDFNEITAMNYILENESNITVQDLFEKYVESFLPLAEDSKSVTEPIIIDTKLLNITGSYSYAPVAIAPRDDFSFVLREGTKITDFSSTWDEKASFNQKIAKTKTDTEWVMGRSGKNMVLGNKSFPSVYIFDENGNSLGTVQYQFPSGNNILRFFDSGRPFVVDIYTNRCVYFPQKSGAAEKLKFPITNVTAILGGPNETLWFGGNNVIFVYTVSGELKDIIQIPTKDGRPLKILSDESFLTLTGNQFSKYNNKGQLVWTKQLDDSFVGGSISGAQNGMYYLYSATDKSLTRIAEADTKLPPVLAAFAGNNSPEQEDTLLNRAKRYLTIAESYFENKSYNSALENFTLYLQICPADSSASEKKIMCEVAINKKSAKEISEKALNLFDEYGEETAKEEYQKAMMLLEKLKKQIPWDTEVQEMYAELKNAFSTDGTFIQANRLSLEIKEVDLNCLFPALISVYANTPSGYIQIKNISDRPIKNISATAYVRKYMDFPSQGETVNKLNAGDDTYLSVSTILNKNVLAINEATPVQMQFTIKWEEDGKQCSTVVTRPVTIYKKSALTWADTAMVACFVQPNDQSVTNFIFNALGNKLENTISTNLTKAIQISNAIGSIPLNYVSDPVTPVTQVINNEYAVDTVRFPADTLSLKGGDCDDITTLFCSLMEGAGINSALITTPGHIFAAFNTGIAYSIVWDNLDAEHMALNIDGKAWLPIETTILSEGFDTAWRTASKEISKEEYEITTLSSAWENYSSVPSDSTAASIALNSSTIKTMNDKNRSTVLEEILSAMKKIDIRNTTSQNLNSLARLYHSLKDDEKAIEILSYATQKDENFRPIYTNLALLYESQGDTEKAKGYREKANNLRAAAANANSDRASDSLAGDWDE